MEVVTSKMLAEKLSAYLRHKLSLADLVDWAENIMMEGDFEDNCDGLRRLIKRINRFVGRRASTNPDEQREAMDRIVETALNLGYTVHLPDLAGYLQQPVTDSEVENLQAMLALLNPSGGEADTKIINDEQGKI